MKAFDTVPHRRLFGKLRAYNIKEDLISWIESFFKNRVQQVVVHGEESEWMDVTSGIPQGSVLCILLFAIYINDLPAEVVSDISLFADNTKIFRIIYIDEDRNRL